MLTNEEIAKHKVESFRQGLLEYLHITEEDVVTKKIQAIEKLFCAALLRTQSTTVIEQVLTEFRFLKSTIYPDDFSRSDGMADIVDSKSTESNLVGVQVSSSAV
jgi:hypothetical protein